MRRFSLVFAVAFALVLPAFADGPVAGIGRVAMEVELAPRMISVAPDGTGLPDARGTARQGESIYISQCAACHGARGEGVGDYPPLVGGRDTLTTDHPLATVGSYWPYATTVWDYINRAMPYQNPGSLRPDDVYAVTAYVLYLNGIVRRSDVLDRKTLPRILMPNRDGFIEDPRPDVR
jgi:S-disulfanyl-L-cysteine oxidoreductase SoxD